MRILDLFAGIGGFALGCERAELPRPVAACEIDRRARSVYARHFPGVRLHEDVTSLSADDVGPVDMICGGWPCQDVSTAGKRRGFDGERSSLFRHVVRLAAELRPRWLFIENVPGLLSSRGGRDMCEVVRELAGLGYSLGWRVLDGCYFGVAQHRRRVFIVAGLGVSGERVREVLFEPEGRVGNPAPRVGAWKTAADGDGGCAVTGCVTTGVAQHNPACDAVNVVAVAPCQTAKPAGDKAQNLVVQGGVRRLMPVEVERLFGFPDGWTAEDADGRAIADTVRYRMLGNSVVVPCIEWIARRIKSAEEGSNA